MKRLAKVLLWTVAAILVLSGALFTGVFLSMRPTTGPKIAAYQNPGAALLVVDIQEDYTGPRAKEPYRDGDRIVAFSNAMIDKAQHSSTHVIFIKNVIANPVISLLAGGINAPGAPGTEMDRRLKTTPDARTFTKTRSDAFSNPDLDTYLREHQVERLYIVGLDAAYCVNATALGALSRGYKVTMLTEGIATESGTPMTELTEAWRDAGATIQNGEGR